MFSVGDVLMPVVFGLIGFFAGMMGRRGTDSVARTLVFRAIIFSIIVVLLGRGWWSSMVVFGMSLLIGFEVYHPRRRDPDLPEVTPLPEVTDLKKEVGPVTSVREQTGGPTPLSSVNQRSGSKLVH